jgi:hypothetical protein
MCIDSGAAPAKLSVLSIVALGAYHVQIGREPESFSHLPCARGPDFALQHSHIMVAASIGHVGKATIWVALAGRRS